MTKDEIHTQAVKALALLGAMANDEQREGYMQALLYWMHQEGEITANDVNIARNAKAFAAKMARVQPA